MTFRFGIGPRLYAAFGFLLLLMIGLTLFSISKMNYVDHDLVQINEVNSVKQRFAINFRGSVHDRAIAIRDVVLRDEPAGRQTAIDLIAKLAATYAENEQKMNAMISMPGAATEPEKAIVAEIADVQSKTNPVVADIIARQMANDPVQAKKMLIEQATPLFVNWLKAINKFIDYQENLNKSVGSGVSVVVAGFQTLALGSLGGAVLMAIAAAFLATRSITLPMAKLQIALQRMAQGNNESTSDIEARSDEVGDLAKAVGAVREAVTSQAEARAAADARRAPLMRTRGSKQPRRNARRYRRRRTMLFNSSAKHLKKWPPAISISVSTSRSLHLSIRCALTSTTRSRSFNRR